MALALVVGVSALGSPAQAAAPTLSTLSPAGGYTTGNTPVTITGTDLADVTSVTFDGAAATIVGTPTATTINVITPSGAFTLADVVVTTPSGTATLTRAFNYQPPPPTISNISPNSGSMAGGYVVFITGTNLRFYSGATIGGQFASINAVNFDGTLALLDVPAHAAGTVDVVYTTNYGSVTVPGGYTYLPPAPVASNTTASAVAYNAGSTAATTFSLAAYATNSPTGYTAGSSTTANGGSVSIDNTGLASYTPPVGFRGNDSFTFTASNPGGTSSPATVTVPVSDPVFTVTLPEATGQIGVAYNTSGAPVTISGGKAPYTVTAVTGYPRALSFNSASQVLSGRVGEDGNWTVAFTITDSSTGAGPYASTVSANLVTTYPDRPTATSFTASGVAYNSGAASATSIDVAPHTGGVINDFFLNNGANQARPSITTAQGGSATIDTNTGMVSYTPPVGFRGNDSFQFIVANALGGSAWETVTVPVSDPVFTVTLLPATGVVGEAYNTGGAAVTVSGGAAPYSNFSATGLPAGLTMNSAGVISGAPTAGGGATVVVRATDSSAGSGPYTSTASATLVIGAPTITLSPAAGALPDASAGVTYSQAITSTGGYAPIAYSVSAGSLPPGTTLAGNGLISGTPTQTGTFNFTVTARDSSSNGYTGQAAYSVRVGAPVIVITSPASGALPDGVGGVAYSRAFTATGGVGTHSFALAGGSLPPGLTLSAQGVLSGTPTQIGSFNFTVAASDSSPAPGPFASVSLAYSLEIAAPTLSLSPAAGALPGGLRTAAYSQAITASGGTGPYVYVVTAGALPDGLALASDGALSGTPTAAGSSSFTVKATDAYGFTRSAAYTLEVGTPVAVVQPRTVVVVGGQSVVIDAAEGAVGLDLIEAQVVTVPAHGATRVDGLKITYTANGVYAGADSFTYTVRNAGGVSAPATVSITVNAAVRPGPDKAVTILAGQTAVVELTEGAFGSPFTGAAVVSISPSTAGAATIAARTGTDGRQLYDLSFKPDNAFTGKAVASYTLSNAFSTSAPGTVTITVEARPDPTRDPEVTGLIAAQGEAARRFATAQISNVNRRMEQLHDGRSGRGFSSGFSLSGGRAAYDQGEQRRMRDGLGFIEALTADAGDALGLGKGLGLGDGLGPIGDASRLGVPERDQGPFGIWVSGAATFGRADDGRDRKGFKFDTDGLTVGVDERVGKALVLGGAVGWATDTSRIGDNGTRNRTDAWSASLYGSWQPTERAYLDVILGYGRLDFDSRRYVTASGDFAYGQRDGGQWFGAVTAGWDVRDKRGVHLTPYGRMEATRSLLGSFTEEGGGPYALAYDRQTARTITGAFGLRGDYALKTRLGQAQPSFRIEYSYDLQGSGAQLIRYADWLDGKVYSLDASPLDRNRVLYGLGVDLLRGDGMRLGLGYEGMLSSDQTSGSIRAKLQTPF